MSWKRVLLVVAMVFGSFELLAQGSMSACYDCARTTGGCPVCGLVAECCLPGGQSPDVDCDARRNAGWTVSDTNLYPCEVWTTPSLFGDQDCRGQHCDSGGGEIPTLNDKGAGPESPILLDLDGNSFHLTSLANGVHFDIDADREMEAVAWTNGAERDGFLAVDRDGNGLIDGGQELFGNHTPLMNGDTATHGYMALAELDSPIAGGNEDGVISVLDEGFSSLLVWVDESHDGISDAVELTLLSASGVEILELSYIQSRRSDRHGNRLWLTSRAWLRNGPVLRPIATTDVLFVVGE